MYFLESGKARFLKPRKTKGNKFVSRKMDCLRTMAGMQCYVDT